MALDLQIEAGDRIICVIRGRQVVKYRGIAQGPRRGRIVSILADRKKVDGVVSGVISELVDVHEDLIDKLRQGPGIGKVLYDRTQLSRNDMSTPKERD